MPCPFLLIKVQKISIQTQSFHRLLVCFYFSKSCVLSQVTLCLLSGISLTGPFKLFSSENPSQEKENQRDEFTGKADTKYVESKVLVVVYQTASALTASAEISKTK